MGKRGTAIGSIVVIVALCLVIVSFAKVSAQQTSSSVPNWVKSISGWWSEGKISDEEYLNATQFLVNSGIIKIPIIVDLQNQVASLKSQLNSANTQIASLQQLAQLQSPSQTNPNPVTSPQTLNLDPQKSLAKSWSHGQISDAQFIQAIQNLMNNGTIPPFNATSVQYNPNQQIPGWIKNNAGWWADGQLSDDEYRAGLKYLFNNGYIHNPTTNSQNNITSQNTAGTYVNNVYKFSMQQPSDWLMKEGITTQVGSAIVMFVPYIQSGQVYVTNINVKTEDMQSYSFTGYIQATKSVLQNLYSANDFLMLNEGSTVVNGKSAYFFQYAVNLGVPIKIKQVIIPNNNNAFIITYGSTQDTYDEYVNQFENTVSSFKFLE